MFQTLAYYATVFHRSFVAYTTARLQALELNFGSLFPIIYVGKHPGCTQAELTAAVLPEREDMGGPLRSGDHIGRAP